VVVLPKLSLVQAQRKKENPVPPPEAKQEDVEAPATSAQSEDLKQAVQVATSRAPEARVLRFPRGHAVGSVYTLDSGESNDKGWTRLGSPLNEIAVPAGKEARLKLEINDLFLLGKLGPEDIQELDLTGLNLKASDWRPVKALKSLRRLILTNAQISESVGADLKQALPDCSIVR